MNIASRYVPLVTRRLEKQRRVGAAKPLDPGDTGRRYSSGTVPLFSTGSGPYSSVVPYRIH